MKYQDQSLLTAIKKAVLHQYIVPLLEQPHPRTIKNKTPFQIYQYDEQPIDYSQVESKMKEEILKKFNEHLYEDEYSKLQMELYSLEKAAEMQKNYIEMLKIQIEAEGFNSKIEAPLPKLQLQSYIVEKKQQSFVEQDKNQKHLNKNSLRIYPCLRVDLQPYKAISLKTIPKLKEIPHQEREIHIKSHRQLIATYTKRSHTSSQENHQKQQVQLHQIDKTLKQNNDLSLIRPSHSNLIGIQKQISFLERAWENARLQKRKDLCKKYKRQLMSLIDQFWKMSGK